MSCTRVPLRWRNGGRQLSGGRCQQKPASAGRCRHPIPERAPEAALRFGNEYPKGLLRCRDRGFGPYLGFEEAPVPKLRLGSRRSSLRQCGRVHSHSWLRTVKDRGFGQSPTQRQHLSLRALRLRCRLGLPSRQRRLGSLTLGWLNRNRKRGNPKTANRWLCPANTPKRSLGTMGFVG